MAVFLSFLESVVVNAHKIKKTFISNYRNWSNSDRMSPFTDTDSAVCQSFGLCGVRSALWIWCVSFWFSLNWVIISNCTFFLPKLCFHYVWWCVNLLKVWLLQRCQGDSAIWEPWTGAVRWADRVFPIQGECLCSGFLGRNITNGFSLPPTFSPPNGKL